MTKPLLEWTKFNAKHPPPGFHSLRSMMPMIVFAVWYKGKLYHLEFYDLDHHPALYVGGSYLTEDLEGTDGDPVESWLVLAEEYFIPPLERLALLAGTRKG